MTVRDLWASLCGWVYRSLTRLMHRFNLHHSRRSGPMEDGVYLHRCEWCGMRRTEVPLWVTSQRMKAEREAA